MRLLILDADTERPDAAGRSRVFLRVGGWWDGNEAAALPDATMEFLYHVPQTAVRYVTDKFGRRQTVSGAWRPGGVVEVEGEWVTEDPADPWATETVPVDPIVVIWPRIVAYATDRMAEGFRGQDHFADEDRPVIDTARRRNGHGAKVRNLIGHDQRFVAHRRTR
jgi:hypothetical protein